MRLTPETLAELRHRCFEFYDGVVANVDLRLRAQPRSVVVTLHCKDRQATSGWSAVVFTMLGVDEFRFELGRFTFEVLSFGLQVVWKDELVYLVLAPAADARSELPELTKNIGYLAGTSCELEVTPLP